MAGGYALKVLTQQAWSVTPCPWHMVSMGFVEAETMRNCNRTNKETMTKQFAEKAILTSLDSDFGIVLLSTCGYILLCLHVRYLP